MPHPPHSKIFYIAHEILSTERTYVLTERESVFYSQRERCVLRESVLKRENNVYSERECILLTEREYILLTQRENDVFYSQRENDVYSQ